MELVTHRLDSAAVRNRKIHGMNCIMYTQQGKYLRFVCSIVLWLIKLAI